MRIAHWRFTVPLRLRSILRAGRVEQELDDELQFHLDHKIEEGIAAGLSPTEARYRALRAMDGLTQRKEEMRDARRVHWLTDFAADARYAVRSLRRTPGLTALVILTLALGIGMTSGPLSMVDALIFRPYPVPNAGNVVTLVSTSHDNAFESFSYREYLDLRDRTQSYDGVIASATMEEVGFSSVAGATPRIRGGMLVSGNYFRVLGVEPKLGRSFRNDEDRVPGRDAVVVLGPEFFKQEFAGDPTVLGRTVRLNGKEFTVIGVAPETFPGMLIFGHPDFYMPLAMARYFSTDRQKDFFEDRDDRELTVRARLKAGVTMAQARSEAAVLAKSFADAYPKQNRDRGAGVRTQFEMRTRADDVNWKFSAIFLTLGLSVLLVACTNVAGLLLSRARGRSREIAIRLAIGSGRFRLVRLLLAESLILSVLGGLAGMAIGYGVVSWLCSFKNVVNNTDLPMAMPFHMDQRVLLASLMLSILSALFCGIAPALQSTSTDLVNGLKSNAADPPGRKHLWARNVLVVAQVAASLMLLTASFLMVRGFGRTLNLSTNFPKEHLMMTAFDPRMVQYSGSQTQQFYKLLTERVGRLPGVQSETLTRNVPLDEEGIDELAFVPDGFPMPRDREHFISGMDTVDEDYFRTLEIAVRGRGFRQSDSEGAPRVAVVNEQFARHYWPDGDALGRYIRLGNRQGSPIQIVGIAANVKYQDTFEKPMDFAYLPMAQNPLPRMTLMVRSSGNPLEMVQAVKEVVRGLNANMPMLQTRSYADYYLNRAVKGPGIATKLVGSMGLVGLLMAIAGLYGLVAYNVSRRTREIGIRMAIGAGRRDVMRLVLGKGLVLVAAGTAIGLVLGFLVERVLNHAIFNGSGVDVVVYLMVVPAMFGITALAAYVPARRASRIAPTEALRYE